MTVDRYKGVKQSELDRIARASFRELCRTADEEMDLLIFAIRRISRSLKNQGKDPEQIAALMNRIKSEFAQRLITEVL